MTLHEKQCLGCSGNDSQHLRDHLKYRIMVNAVQEFNALEMHMVDFK